MEEIKYWIYYLKDNEEPYAYTDNKYYAKRFEIDRDMEKFNKVKKKLNHNEINYLAKEFQTYYLEEVKIEIYDKSKLEWIDTVMVMTISEHLTISNAEISFMNDEIFRYCETNPSMFKVKIFKALEILEYNNLYRFLSSTIYDNDFDDNISMRIKPDLFGIFIHYYGKTMRGD